MTENSLSHIRFDLSYVQPFDFQKSLDFIGEFPATQHEQTIQSNSLKKSIRINQKTIVFYVQAQETDLKVDAYSAERLTGDDTESLKESIQFFLSLEDDLMPFYALAKQDDAFATKVLNSLYGYHQVKFLTAFENAMWAILSQRTPIAVAQGIKTKLSQTFSQELVVDGIPYCPFPSVEDFLPINQQQLQTIVGNERKTQYLTNVIEAFSTFDASFLRYAPYDAVKQALLDIKGIGEWSASFVLIRGLGRLEEILSNNEDSMFSQRMLEAAKKVYGEITFSQLQQRATHYENDQGYWGHYLRAYSE